MEYLTHDQISGRIIEVLKTFNTFPLNVYNPSLVWNIAPPSTAREFNRIVDNDSHFRLILRKLNNEAILEMYNMCRAVAAKYNMRVKVPLGEVSIASGHLEANSGGKTLEKLTARIEKFGNEELNKRLGEVRSGQSRIVFEEMEGGREGHTVFDNGQITYKLNKRYEKSGGEDLWRASVILAHELQRNPETGDLKGETAEIVLRDMAFVEQLASAYGKKVYEQIPEFEIMHYVKKLFGEESLKEFVEVAFNHAGSYWELNENGDLVDTGASDVRDGEGNILHRSSGGRQRTLETWLGLTSAEVWQHLLQPAGYTHRTEGGRFTWTNTPGIPRAVIDRAHANGILTDEMYAKITRGRNPQPLEAPNGLPEAQRENVQELRGAYQRLMEQMVAMNLHRTNTLIINWDGTQWITDRLRGLGETINRGWNSLFGRNTAAVEPIEKYIPQESPQETPLERFVTIVRSLVGVPYHQRYEATREGMDCSGVIVYALRKMGYNIPRLTAARMENGTSWITVTRGRTMNQGTPGVLNFFIWEGYTTVGHVNVGVGQREDEPEQQIIDATSNDWMVNHRSLPYARARGQVVQPGERQVNQTFAPFVPENDERLVSQGVINFELLEREFKAAE